MKFLIFEGISGSGKSTLISHIKEWDNYGYIQIHRFTPTQWVYDRVYNRREIDYENFNKNFQNIGDVYVIWCYCTPEIALERQNNKVNDTTEDLVKAVDLFDEYFTKISTWDNIIKVNTGVLSIEETLETIKTKIYRE